MEELSVEAKWHYQVLLGQGLQIMFQTEGKPEGWKSGSKSRIEHGLKDYLKDAEIIAAFLLKQEP